MLAILGRATAADTAETPVGVLVAQYYVEAAPSMFHSLYGRWPSKWAEVQRSGLVTAELFSPLGQPINPDDERVDGLYDIVYSYSDGQPPAVTTYLDFNGKPEKLMVALEPQIPMREFLSRTSYRKLAEDPEAMRQVSIGRLLNMGIMFFNSKHGRWPSTWEEFILSDVSPLAPQSINSASGKKYMGDGSKGDFRFRAIFDKAGKQTSAYVYWVDLSGQKIEIYF
jgi:hypothetical protein